jgi:ParB family chromosome partitioning protein
MELALVENLQREDLNPIEEAEAFHRLAGDFGLTQEQIADRVGKQRSTVANRIRLLELEPEIQDHVRQGRMSAGHARALLAISNGKERQELAGRCIQESLSVRQVEEAVKRGSLPEKVKPVKAKKVSTTSATGVLPELEEEMQQALGTRVRIIKQGLGGRIEIEFYGDEDITRIYELIVKP